MAAENQLEAIHLYTPSASPHVVPGNEEIKGGNARRSWAAAQSDPRTARALAPKNQQAHPAQQQRPRPKFCVSARRFSALTSALVISSNLIPGFPFLPLKFGEGRNFQALPSSERLRCEQKELPRVCDDQWLTLTLMKRLGTALMRVLSRIVTNWVEASMGVTET